MEICHIGYCNVDPLSKVHIIITLNQMNAYFQNCIYFLYMYVDHVEIPLFNLISETIHPHIYHYLATQLLFKGKRALHRRVRSRLVKLLLS